MVNVIVAQLCRVKKGGNRSGYSGTKGVGQRPRGLVIVIC